MSEQLERKQQAERFKILDPAKTPEKPIRPKRIPFFAGSIVAAFFPVGIAILMEALSGVVKSEGQLKALLPPKVPLLERYRPL